jgi:hypothetical protein
MAALMLAALAPGQATASPGAYRVLIVHSDNNGIPTRLRTQIAAEPDLVALDSFNAQVSTPDAAFLDGYDLVVNVTLNALHDRVLYGNALADYLDQGGVLVETSLEDRSDLPNNQPGGRFDTGNYRPFIGSPADVEDLLTLGLHDPSIPLFNGVDTVSTYYATQTTPTAGSKIAASWSDGHPMAMYKGRVVYINTYVGEAMNEPFPAWSGAYGKLTMNAVRWLGRHTLTVSTSGAGSVTSSSGGIACGTSCSADYPYITSVTLAASPAPGAAFAGWGGACAGSAPTCSVSVDQAKGVTAAFVPAPAPTTGPASFKLLSKLVRINLRTGRGSQRAICTNVAADVCRFKLTIRAPSTRAAAKRKAKGLIVGRVTGTLGGGKRGNLKVKLSSKGLKRLRGARGRKLKVTIAGTSVNRGGKATKVSQKLAVVAKHPKKRH